MSTLTTLLDKFWIVKDADRKLFFQVQKELPDYRKFIQENIGWRIMNSETMVRVEKTTGEPEAFMGIQDFKDQTDYMLFCALLVFLEEKEEKAPFLFSELTSFLSAQLAQVMEVEWTSFTLRKSLIRVIQYAVKMNLIVLHDGNLDSSFTEGRSEALYENTGLSRYYAVHYSFDTTQFSTIEEYQNQSLSSADTDHGHFRTNRVYQKLLTRPALYWEDNAEADIDYLRKQRAFISKNMQEQLGARLDIHRNAAYLVFEDESEEFGSVFPSTSTLSDVILLVCREIQNAQLMKDHCDCSHITAEHLFQMIAACKKKYQSAWSKEYSSMDLSILTERVTAAMEEWMLLKKTDDEIVLYPAVYRLAGIYPKDFVEEAVVEKKKKKEKNVEKPQLF